MSTPIKTEFISHHIISGKNKTDNIMLNISKDLLKALTKRDSAIY